MQLGQVPLLDFKIGTSRPAAGESREPVQAVTLRHDSHRRPKPQPLRRLGIESLFVHLGPDGIAAGCLRIQWGRRLKGGACSVPVQRSHDADAREHRWAAMLCHQDQGFDRGLPLWELLFGLGKLLDIFGGVLKGDELAAARQRDRIIERTFPPRWFPTRRDRSPPA
jgi:hypothetical protein